MGCNCQQLRGQRAIRIWDLHATDPHRALTDAADSLWAVAFSPNGKRVAAAGSDRMIRVYDPETGKLEATLKGAKSPITSLAFFPDSNRLVAAGGDRIVVVWDVGEQKVIKEFAGHRVGRSSRSRFRMMEGSSFRQERWAIGRFAAFAPMRTNRRGSTRPARRFARWPSARGAARWPSAWRMARSSCSMSPGQSCGARADRSCRGRRVPRLQPRWQPAGERRRRRRSARLVGR